MKSVKLKWKLLETMCEGASVVAPSEHHRTRENVLLLLDFSMLRII